MTRSELLPSSRAHLERVAAANLPPAWEIGHVAFRESSEATASKVCGAHVEIGDVRDIAVAGAEGPLRGRCYRADGAPSAGAPSLLWLHGGGWAIGTLDTYDDLCRRLAADSGGVVVAVGYRLAPEHPFPAPVEDATAAARDVLGRAEELGLDPSRLVVGGDSAGGALAAAVANRAVREGWKRAPWAQLLVYPVTEAGVDWRSCESYGVDHYLDVTTMRWFWEQYCPDAADRTNPDAAPLHAEVLDGVAPAHVLVASHDILRDQGLAYADRLREAGVHVTTAVAEGHLHGFLRWTGVVPESLDEIAALGGVLRAWWAPS